MCIVVDLCRAMQGEHVSVLGKDALHASKGICMGSWEHSATVSLSGVVCRVSCTSACVSEHLCVCMGTVCWPAGGEGEEKEWMNVGSACNYSETFAGLHTRV